jgi:hypothetical protein
MRRIALTLFLLALAAVPARAHFLWLLPDSGDKPGVRMVFSDKLEPDDASFLDYLKKAEVFACTADGKSTTVKFTQVKDALVPELPGGCAVAARVKFVSERAKPPYLVAYHAKTWTGDGKSAFEMMKAAGGKLDFDISLDGFATGKLVATWKGKPIANAEVVLIVPGVDKNPTATTDDKGAFDLVKFTKPGLYGIRVKHVVKQAGELDGKKYEEERHYATLVFDTRYLEIKPGKVDPKESPARPAPESPVSDLKESPEATKLLADARAARASWDGFTGFTADLEVNVDGKVTKGKVDVDAKGKVTLSGVSDTAIESQTRRQLSSIVGHRMSDGGEANTPCAFADDNADHPLGRAIQVLNDEFHSSYRIRDRQVIVVNRSTKDLRFTITVMENRFNEEKKYLPASYVVNYWDLDGKALRKSETFHQEWKRVGKLDLPLSSMVVIATPDGKLEARSLKLSNHKLK